MTIYAVHCPNNAALLIRLYNDLISEGLPTDEQWNGRIINSHRLPTNLRVYECGEVNLFRRRKMSKNYQHRALTPETYDSILQEIINSRK